MDPAADSISFIPQKTEGNVAHRVSVGDITSYPVAPNFTLSHRFAVSLKTVRNICVLLSFVQT